MRVQALEAGALGAVSMDQGWCLAVKLQGYAYKQPARVQTRNPDRAALSRRRRGRLLTAAAPRPLHATRSSSAASVGTLLRFLYTEQFSPAGRDAAVALLRLLARFEAAAQEVAPTPPPHDCHTPSALRRLRQ